MELKWLTEFQGPWGIVPHTGPACFSMGSLHLGAHDGPVLSKKLNRFAQKWYYYVVVDYPTLWSQVRVKLDWIMKRKQKAKVYEISGLALNLKVTHYRYSADDITRRLQQDSFEPWICLVTACCKRNLKGLLIKLTCSKTFFLLSLYIKSQIRSHLVHIEAIISCNNFLSHNTFITASKKKKKMLYLYSFSSLVHIGSALVHSASRK